MWSKMILDDNIQDIKYTKKGNGVIVKLQNGRKLLFSNNNFELFKVLDKPFEISVKFDGDIFVVGNIISMPHDGISFEMLDSIVQLCFDKLNLEILYKHFTIYYNRQYCFYCIKQMQSKLCPDAIGIGILASSPKHGKDPVIFFQCFEFPSEKMHFMVVETMRMVWVQHLKVANVIEHTLMSPIFQLRKLSNAIKMICDFERLSNIILTQQIFDIVCSRLESNLSGNSFGLAKNVIQERIEVGRSSDYDMIRSLAYLYSDHIIDGMDELQVSKIIESFANGELHA